MRIVRRPVPPDSAFLGDLARFYYWDSYEARLTRGDLAMHELYLALFGHPPRWMIRLLGLRDWLVRPFGLRPAMATRIVETKPTYRIGDKIARFTLYAQDDSEIVTGGDDTHLDFRVSLSRQASRLALSTVVTPHNFLGRAYLFLILPFHRFGVRTLLANAVAAGRI